jgi:hypothetical protein
VRKIQKNLELLSMNDTWSLKAQTWSEDQKMLDNLMTCAHHADNKSVLLLEPGARRRGRGVDGSEPDAGVASLRDFSAEGQPDVEGGEGGAQEQLASWEASVNEKHEAALRGMRCSYKQSVFGLEPHGGAAWLGAAADITDVTAWKCQSVCVPHSVPRQGAVSLRCVKCHCGETGFLGMPVQSEGDLLCVKCHRKKSLHCPRLTRSVPRQGAVSLWCVKCHCGETGVLRVPGQSAGDLRYVKCHRRKSQHCLRMTRSVPRQGAVSLRCVKCHCGKTASCAQLIMSGKGIARQWAKAKAAAERAAKEKLSVRV